MTGKSRLFFYLLALIASLILVGAALSCARLRSVGGGERPPTSPLTIKLELAKAPRLNEPVTLTATLTATRDDAPNSEAWIELPTGAVYVDGALTWRGDVMAGAPVQFSATIAIVEDGRWDIKGNSYRTNIEDQSSWIGRDAVYLTMEKGQSQVGWEESQGPAYGISIDAIPEIDRPVGHNNLIFDNSSLVNGQDTPLFLVVYNDHTLGPLLADGLFDNERWGPWRSVRDVYWDEGLLIAVYDQQRASTGYRVFVEGITGRGPQVKVYVRMEAPAAETPRTQIPTSAYNVAFMSKQFVSKDGATEFIFLVNGQEVTRQTYSIPTAWYNTLACLGETELGQRARYNLSQLYGIPEERLALSLGNDIRDYAYLWQRVRGAYVVDRETRQAYSVEVDCSGNILDTGGGLGGSIDSAAKIARKYGKLDKKLYDLLQTKEASDTVEVAIWAKGAPSARTLMEAQQPLVDYLGSRGYQALPSDRIPATFATLSKQSILDVASRNDVAVILLSDRFGQRLTSGLIIVWRSLAFAMSPFYYETFSKPEAAGIKSGAGSTP